MQWHPNKWKKYYRSEPERNEEGELVESGETQHGPFSAFIDMLLKKKLVGSFCHSFIVSKHIHYIWLFCKIRTITFRSLRDSRVKT